MRQLVSEELDSCAARRVIQSWCEVKIFAQRERERPHRMSRRPFVHAHAGEIGLKERLHGLPDLRFERPPFADHSQMTCGERRRGDAFVRSSLRHHAQPAHDRWAHSRQQLRPRCPSPRRACLALGLGLTDHPSHLYW